MFRLLNIQTVGAVIVAASLLASGAYVWGRIDGAALKDAAIAEALEEARANTEKAINELADEADQARVRRRICLDGGGVWSFSNNECI